MHIIPSFTWEGFYLGPAYIYTWGLTVAIGIVVAGLIAAKKAVKIMPEDKFWNLLILLVLAIFLGARLFYILETWSYYAHNFSALFRLWEGGFSLFGGVIGGLSAGWLWGRKNKVDFLALGWIFTPAWLIGLFFGRVGCFLIHDHLGQPTDLPWGIFVQGAYRHEPALYEAVLVLLIALGFWFWKTKNRKLLFPASLILYSVGRFFLDFLRVDDQRYISLTVAQWFCIAIFVWCLTVMGKIKDSKQS